MSKHAFRLLVCSFIVALFPFLTPSAAYADDGPPCPSGTHWEAALQRCVNN